MIKDIEISLNVNTLDKTINVEAEVTFNEKLKNIEFWLNKGLKVDSILDDATNKINFNVEENNDLMFVAPCNKISIELPEETYSIKINYSGQVVHWWYTTISDTYVSLSLYSAWFPIIGGNIENPIDKIVSIKGLEDFIILKGKKQEDTWIYKCKDFDCNILAVKDWVVTSVNNIQPKLNVYVCGNKKNDAEIICKSFHNILKFYLELFKDKSVSMESFDILITDTDKDSGGYCREGLIVLSKLSSKIVDTESLLAHEFAHIWSTGASVSSWEDWLNETFAETLALFYIEKEYGKIIYMDRINSIKEKAIKFPAIKTKDGKRPDGVHHKGTYLMYLLRDKFGDEVLKTIIKLFVKLEVKTTENLLNSIRSNISENVAEFISVNLNKEEYTS